MTATATDAPRFDVLRVQRGIRDDHRLTAHQNSFLLCAALRADNDSLRGRKAGKVRSSLSQLAVESGASVDAVSRWLRASSPDYSEAVVSHFARIERPHARQVNLWFPVS